MTAQLKKVTRRQLATNNRARILSYIISNPGKTTAELAIALSINVDGMKQYCLWLHDAGSIRRVHHDIGFGKVSYLVAWSAGSGDDEPLRPERRGRKAGVSIPLHTAGQVTRIIVPAVQLGMVRDSMISAFYGSVVHS